MPNRADTSLGHGGAQFRSTIWNCLEMLQGPDRPEKQDAFDQIVRWYWKPVYRFIRVGWNRTNDDAKDLTQGFFETMLHRDALAKADPARGKFRTFLKTAVRNFLANEHRGAQAVKRGGGRSILPTDFQEDPPDLVAPSASPDDIFEREWARTLVSTALERLRAAMQGEQELHFRIFEACDLHDAAVPDPTHEELAQRFSLSAGEIKRILKSTRVRLRDFVVEEIRKYAQSDEEVWEERDYLISLWDRK